MEFNFGTARPLSTQQAFLFNRFVPTDRPTQISEDLDQSHLITTFTISNFSTNPAPVYLGNDAGMHATIEIVPGAAPVFTAWQEGRQMYELQVLIMKIASQTAGDLIKVPIIVWDLTRWYLQTSGSQGFEVTIAAFPLPYL